MESATNADSPQGTGRRKILHLITKSNWGGAQKYVFELAIGLPKDRYEVAVGLGGDGELKTRLEASGIRTISLPYLGRDIALFGDIATFFRLLSLLRKERPDVVHVNSSKIGGLGTLAGRIAGIRKIIFTGHGWAFNENRSLISRIAIKFLHWLTIVLSHQTIVVSTFMKNQMARLPLMKGKITVIHNGVAPIDFVPRNEARAFLAEKAGLKTIPENALWIGTIAELHSNKGIEYLIESLRRAANHDEEFLFFAIGEGEERKKLEEKIREAGLRDKAFLCGHVSNAARYLQALDIFTLTSITEGLAYVLIEAGQASLPVLASSTGGIPEIIANDELGILVQPRNVKDITLGLETLLDEPALREKLGANLRERVTKEFSFEKMLRETEKLYS